MIERSIYLDREDAQAIEAVPRAFDRLPHHEGRCRNQADSAARDLVYRPAAGRAVAQGAEQGSRHQPPAVAEGQQLFRLPAPVSERERVIFSKESGL